MTRYPIDESNKEIHIPINAIAEPSSFQSDLFCYRFLFRVRSLSHGRLLCNKCDHLCHWLSRNGKIVCKYCGNQQSILDDTIFNKSHIKISKWFRILWWFAKQRKRPNAFELYRYAELGSYQTAWKALHLIREQLKLPKQITRNLEVGYTLLENRLGMNIRSWEPPCKVLVLINSTMESAGEVILAYIFEIPDDINEIVKNLVSISHPDYKTRVVPPFGVKTKLGERKVIHSPITRDMVNIDLSKPDALPMVRRIGLRLKRWMNIGINNGVKVKHLRSYLYEFEYRHNRWANMRQSERFKDLLMRTFSRPGAAYFYDIYSKPSARQRYEDFKKGMHTFYPGDDKRI